MSLSLADYNFTAGSPTPTPDFSGITTPFTNTSLFGFPTLITLIITFTVCLIITRDPKKWRSAFLPAYILMGIIGLPTHPLFYVGGALLMVFDAVSPAQIGNILTPTTEWINTRWKTSQTTGVRAKEKKHWASLREEARLEKAPKPSFTFEDKPRFKNTFVPPETEKLSETYNREFNKTIAKLTDMFVMKNGRYPTEKEQEKILTTTTKYFRRREP